MTSQNSLQLLVSKKCDLADSIGSDLTSIELLFACIAAVVEGLTAAVARQLFEKPGYALTGEATGLIDDVRPAADLLQKIVADAERLLGAKASSFVRVPKGTASDIADIP